MATIFREKSDPGEWLCLLLPLAISISRYKEEDSSSFNNNALFISWCLAAYSIYFSFKIYGFQSFEEYFKIKAANIVPQLQSFNFTKEAKVFKDAYSSLMRWKLAQTKTLALFFTATFFVCTFESSCILTCGLAAFIYYLPRIFILFPRSFSLGEGSLVLQSAVLFITTSIISLREGSDDPTTIVGSYSLISKTIILSLIIVCLTPKAPKCEWILSPTYFYVYGFAFLSCITIPLLQIQMRRNPVIWIVGTMTGSLRLVLLVWFWCCCVLASIIILNQRTTNGDKASTQDRKYFHGLVVLVFTSGVLIEPHFLFFASSIVLALMLLAEFLRLQKIEPIGALIDKSFALFLDDKDAGSLILSHMYLLVGASLPLWLSGNLDNVNPLVLLCGVISIGIGDSAASIVGSSWDQTMLPNSSKTVEGTAASILSQVTFILFLSFLSGNVALNSGLMFVVTFCSLVEAFTSQVDNIALPLLMFPLISIFT